MPQADFSHVCCVGVDEMSVRKGQEYISVFADLVRKRVLFATEGKDRETWPDSWRRWKNTMATGMPSRRRAWT